MKLFWNYNEIEVGNYYISHFNTLKKKRLNNIPYADLKPINIKTLKHILSANDGVFIDTQHLYEIVPMFQDTIE